MIYPPVGKLAEKTDSRYSLVIAAAKRAREISEDPAREVKKPVIEAIGEIYEGKVAIVSGDQVKEREEEYVLPSIEVEE